MRNVNRARAENSAALSSNEMRNKLRRRLKQTARRGETACKNRQQDLLHTRNTFAPQIIHASKSAQHTNSSNQHETVTKSDKHCASDAIFDSTRSAQPEESKAKESNQRATLHTATGRESNASKAMQKHASSPNQCDDETAAP